MEKIRVGVIRGGVGEEYPVSLKTGAAVLRHLFDRYHPLISSSTKRVFGTVMVSSKTLIESLLTSMLSLTLCMGFYGEDGKIQTLFNEFDVTVYWFRIFTVCHWYEQGSR